MSRPQIIDTKMHGEPGLTSTFLVRGEKTALVETGPKSSIDHVKAGLQDAGVETLDHIVVTHIHLDHAGAAGTLARLLDQRPGAPDPVARPPPGAWPSPRWPRPPTPGPGRARAARMRDRSRARGCPRPPWRSPAFRDCAGF